MKEHPILFKPEMVRAIFEGRKTQTRRIIKKQPHGIGEWVSRGINWLFPNVNPYIAIKCPWGVAKDRLWVRENWQNITDECGNNWFYQADMENTPFCNDDQGNPIYFKWRPSIHMPREACRLTLIIDEIRVERLQDITEEDARAEGIVVERFVADEGIAGYQHRIRFRTLWDQINGKKHPWESSPWVWVIKFHREV